MLTQRADASIHTVSEAWALADMATTRLPPARSSKMLHAKQDICERKRKRENMSCDAGRVACGVAPSTNLLQGQFNHSSAALAQRLQHPSAVVLHDRIPANNSPARAYAQHNIGVINLAPGAIARVEQHEQISGKRM